VSVKIIPVPAHRRFEAVAMPSLEGGIDALRQVMQLGLRPAVIRLYDAEASSASLSPIVGRTLADPTVLLMFEGEREVADAEAEVTLRLLAGQPGAAVLESELCSTWWERRYDFYHPPHYPRCPRCGGRSTRSRPTGASSPSTTGSAPRSSPSPTRA
jgi:alkyldihydroxyacetonephosphate synthase